MTYSEWKSNHIAKLTAIVEDNVSKPVSDLIDIFNYDNMVSEYPDFCPLYKEGTRCHNVSDLNCFLCACPYFVASETKPIGITFDNKLVMSQCTINSKFAVPFVQSAPNQSYVHCDCSSCLVPHHKPAILKHVSNYMPDQSMQDGYSLLEHIRNYQLSGIFGKLKLF